MHNRLGIKITAALFVTWFALLTASPLLIKPLIIKQAGDNLNAELQIESLLINPFTLSVSAENLHLTNANKQPLANIGKFYLNVDVLPIILLNAKVKSLQVDNIIVYPSPATETKNTPLLEVESISANNIVANLLSQLVDIESIAIHRPDVNAILFSDRALNLDRFQEEINALLKVSTKDSKGSQAGKVTTGKNSETAGKQNTGAEPQKSSQEESPDWLVRLLALDINSASLNLYDFLHRSTEDEEALKTSVTQLNIKLRDIHSNLSHPMNLKLEAQLLAGTTSISGQLTPGNMESSINYEFKDLQLQALDPYARHFTYLNIDSGELTSRGNIETSQTRLKDKNDESTQTQETLKILISNQTQVQSLSITHESYDPTLLECKNLETGTSEFSSAENSLTVEKVLVSGCQAGLVIESNGKGSYVITRKEALKEQKATQGKKPKNNQSRDTKDKINTPVNISVNKILLENNQIKIKDISQGEAVNINIAPLNASIENLSSGKEDATQLNLTATLNDHAPLEIVGTGNFLNPKLSADIRLILKKMGLKDFSPYTVNLSSRAIEQGVLSVDIKTVIDKNKLDSDNNLSIHGLKMGKKQNTGGNLPIALAATVLRNTQGDIHLDVPVSGDLDDPGFSISKQVLRTLRTIITKAAAAPLTMLGGLVASDGTGTHILVLADNAAVLSEDDRKHIEKVAEVLEKKPELVLGIEALLSSSEVSTLSAERKTALLKKRVDNFQQIMTDLGVADEQLEIVSPDIETAHNQAGLAIDVYTR